MSTRPSMVPQHFRDIDPGPPVIVREVDAATACRELLTRHGLFVGGSSGSVYHAAKQVLTARAAPGLKAALIFADLGDRYADTLFDDGWCRRLLPADASTPSGHVAESTPAPLSV